MSASDCETCNDLNNGDSVDCAMLCIDVPAGCNDICRGDACGPTLGTQAGVTGVPGISSPTSSRVLPATRTGSM
jgi:hypothetical protein